ncbi:MAG TPA: hypothetical protein DCG47_14665 [Spirochaetaceae bacterium]|jgi:hypothetical protein|nr:hypothetical protein [Spirochaetaceae bacterium]
MKKPLAFAFAFFLALPLFADVKVVSVKGVAGYLSGGKLQPLAVGMSLANDATVVTGANSELGLQINNGTITLKALTTAKLSGISLSDSASSADVAIRSGTVVSDVKQIKGLKTNFTVSTPVGTSSVRGTEHSVSYSRERGMQVSVLTGIVDVDSVRSAARPVTAGNGFVQAPGAPPLVAAQAALAASSTSAIAAFAPGSDSSTGIAADPLSSQLNGFINAVSGSPGSGTLSLFLLFP